MVASQEMMGRIVLPGSAVAAEQERSTFSKGFALIDAWKANELGILTEGPVFTSESVSNAVPCKHCNVEFTAIVYQQGHIVTAQHFHDSPFEGGGIYYEERSEEATRRPRGMYGWSAEVSPLGKRIRDALWRSDGTYDGRSEALVVGDMHASCFSCDFYTNTQRDNRVDNGVVGAYKNPKYPAPYRLLPFHDERCAEEYGTEVLYDFSTIRGRIYFR